MARPLNIKSGLAMMAFLLVIFLLPQNIWAQETMDPSEDQVCCICLAEDCCFLLEAQRCDEEGNLRNAELLEEFFEALGLSGSQFCNTCSQCAQNPFSPEEDAQFLDVCDICVFEPINDPTAEPFMCTVVPPEMAEPFLGGGGSCSLGSLGTLRSRMIPFNYILGPSLILGWILLLRRRAFC